MTDKQRKELALVAGGVAIGMVGGYFIGKVVGSKEGIDIAMRKFNVLSEAAKTYGEFPMILEHAPTKTKVFLKVLPEATEEFKDMVRAF